MRQDAGEIALQRIDADFSARLHAAQYFDHIFLADSDAPCGVAAVSFAVQKNSGTFAEGTFLVIIQKHTVSVALGVIDEMLPGAVVGLFCNIDQLIVIILISAPVEIAVYFHIGYFRAGVFLNTKAMGEVEDPGGRFLIAFPLFINTVFSNLSAAGEDFFPFSVIFIVQDDFGFGTAGILYKQKLVGGIIILIAVQDIIPFCGVHRNFAGQSAGTDSSSNFSRSLFLCFHFSFAAHGGNGGIAAFPGYFFGSADHFEGFAFASVQSQVGGAQLGRYDFDLAGGPAPVRLSGDGDLAFLFCLYFPLAVYGGDFGIAALPDHLTGDIGLAQL